MGGFLAFFVELAAMKDPMVKKGVMASGRPFVATLSLFCILNVMLFRPHWCAPQQDPSHAHLPRQYMEISYLCCPLLTTTVRKGQCSPVEMVRYGLWGKAAWEHWGFA